MNCDSYLFSIEDASRLLRMSRTDFEEVLLGKDIPFVVEKKKVMGKLKDVKLIRHYHLREFLEKREVIYG